MKKIAVFDLDNTLCPLGLPITDRNQALLKELEADGMRICIASGKPLYYLTGFLRQLGLAKPLLLGENGACFQEGVDLPPKVRENVALAPETKRVLRVLRDRMEEAIPELWFQPNEIMLTPFPKDENEKSIIRRVLSEVLEDDPGKYHLDIYEHCDSFDIVPRKVDKGYGLTVLGRFTGCQPADMIAIGDGVNDYPMFEKAGLSIGIGISGAPIDVSVSSIDEALEYIKNNRK